MGIAEGIGGGLDRSMFIFSMVIACRLDRNGRRAYLLNLTCSFNSKGLNAAIGCFRRRNHVCRPSAHLIPIRYIRVSCVLVSIPLLQSAADGPVYLFHSRRHQK